MSLMQMLRTTKSLSVATDHPHRFKVRHGAPPPFGNPGRPGVADEVTSASDFLWWLHDGHRAIRVGDWKLVAAAKEPWELYDLKSDRAEQKNLAAKMPEKVKELSELWQKQTDAFVASVKKPPAKGKDE